MFASMCRFVSFILFVLVGTCSSVQAIVTFESSASFKQEGSVDYEGTEDPEPVDFVNRTATTPNSTFTFNTQIIPDNPFELKAKAGLDVSINGRGSDVGWGKVQARTTAKTSLIDFGIVENFGGATNGFVHFTWAVSGTSTIKLDPVLESDAYIVDQLFTLASLTSTVESDVPDILLNDQALPIGQSTVDSVVPDSVGFQEFIVPWTANVEVPIVFDLAVTAALSAFNADAAGFTAKLDADYTNTATLASVEIFDADGNLLESASFVGRDDLVYAKGDDSGGGGDPQDVTLDIKPGSDTNSVNLKSKGVLPMAVLGTDDFDVTSIDGDSLLFGDPALIGSGAIPISPCRIGFEDVSGDGIDDLILKFKMADLIRSGAIDLDSTEGLLTGALLDGSPLSASDTLTVVPKNGKGKKKNKRKGKAGDRAYERRRTRSSR